MHHILCIMFLVGHYFSWQVITYVPGILCFPKPIRVMESRHGPSHLIMHLRVCITCYMNANRITNRGNYRIRTYFVFVQCRSPIRVCNLKAIILSWFDTMYIASIMALNLSSPSHFMWINHKPKWSQVLMLDDVRYACMRWFPLSYTTPIT